MYKRGRKAKETPKVPRPDLGGMGGNPGSAPVISAGDFANEAKITLSAAAKLMGVSYPSVRYYCGEGIQGIYLECLRLDGKTLTSREAVMRFTAKKRSIQDRTRAKYITPEKAKVRREVAQEQMRNVFAMLGITRPTDPSTDQTHDQAETDNHKGR